MTDVIRYIMRKKMLQMKKWVKKYFLVEYLKLKEDKIGAIETEILSKMPKSLNQKLI